MIGRVCSQLVRKESTSIEKRGSKKKKMFHNKKWKVEDVAILLLR